MALVMFSCRATGPLLMFEETVRRIFKETGIAWREQGAIAAGDLPEFLAKLEEAARLDKEREEKRREDEDKRRRESSYDKELRRKEDTDEERREKERVAFFQRIFPLRDLVRRAIKAKEPVMWSRP